MSSNTQPLPASEFRRIDDKLYFYAMAVLNKGDRGAWGDEECALFGFCREYEAARAASPVTLEEFLIVQEEEAQWCRTEVDWATASQMTHERALILIEERNARRLAGEGGGK